MKRFVMALALTCALSGAALAGDIPSTGASSPIVTVILTILSLVR